MTIDLSKSVPFSQRHNGPSAQDIEHILEQIDSPSVEALISETIPAAIRLEQPLATPEALSEQELLAKMESIGKKNKIFRSYIGAGYYDTVLPNVIKRNILENPGWYTAYTPYQAEIAQGRLEMLINFQTMISDLTGMELANASLLDEATAAAEAMSMLFSVRKGKKKKNAFTFLVDEACHPQTLDVLRTRALPMDITLEITSVDNFDVTRDDIYGLLVQNPNTYGELKDYTALFESAAENDVFTAASVDPMSLLLVKSPGEMGADVVSGSAQRFGVPMGFGGPHAAFFATKEKFKRQIPGRIIGVTKDADGNPAFRMALQTREQHIRREKATSNICTAQVLLAVMAAAYGVYHGPEGLKSIAEKIHGKAVLIKKALTSFGFTIKNQSYFDTLLIEAEEAVIEKILDDSADKEINLRRFDDKNLLGISLDEAKTLADIEALIDLFQSFSLKETAFNMEGEISSIESDIPESLHRNSDYMDHPVFHDFRTEHEMLRYLKRLENKDLSLVHSMISLGSCTMKLNATSEMIPITWPEFAQLHPFAPESQTKGYSQLTEELGDWLKEITGFSAVSFQPNSGAQGEFAGLMTIRAYHKHNGDNKRVVTLIPSSAHGTNPASAVMAGMNVVVVKCDDHGNIDFEDLRAKAEKHADNLSALMVTYPSTHGVFEENIKEICEIIHDNGGLVYMDGANMNAQVGLTSPAAIGADVCHLNLHKTFCIPHGGGGPGMGPICANDKLKPLLPNHGQVSTGGPQGITAVSAAPFGSASILAISYAYIAMMGSKGLQSATEIAILNANYIKSRLKEHYPILYTGKSGRTAHEFIIDLRPFKQSAGIEVLDIAKRLMDYGFHAPTVSFPVSGTMMIEPTESESVAELDRFCEAMITIREEIAALEEGKADKENNVLKNAPHTSELITADEWEFPYSRSEAAYPLPWVKARKFWPSVRRVDDAYGDRNLMCSCPSMDAYEETIEPVMS